LTFRKKMIFIGKKSVTFFPTQRLSNLQSLNTFSMDIKSGDIIKDEVYGKVGTERRDNLDKDFAVFKAKLEARRNSGSRHLHFAGFDYIVSKWRYIMKEVVIDKKKYILIPEENFQELRKAAAGKWKPEKTFTISEARAFSKNRIREWASEK
jgi:hypothetical protein